MSVLGRQLISRFCLKSIKNSVPCIATSRFSGNVAEKKQVSDDCSKAIPDPIPGMIQRAILKNYSSPLVIENVEPPKIINPNEVNLQIIKFIYFLNLFFYI